MREELIGYPSIGWQNARPKSGVLVYSPRFGARTPSKPR